MRYSPHTEADKALMLEKIGAKSVTGLFSDIEASIFLKKPLNLGPGLSEQELVKHVKEISARNASLNEYKSFLGAGAYQHFIPSVVAHLAGRSEFYTAYTPYQPEVSQGTLQSIYEYQTMICELTGMDVANASMYDGASALAEAGLMASGITRRKELVVSSTVHPEHRETVRTYADAHDLTVKQGGFENGVTDLKELSGLVSENTAAVMIQNPNFFGCLEDLKETGEQARAKGALFIVSVVEPTSLAVLKPPGDYGADIVVGEGQSFGNSLSFGGPFLGFMATKKEHVRKIPGRLSGMTLDANGRRGFVLTLQTREQHIRRERATSNICSNEALNALIASIYLATLGKTGLKKVAERSARNAHYLAESLHDKGFSLAFDQPFYNEFTVTCPSSPEKINQEILKKKVIGGLPVEKYYPSLKNAMLLCSTEVHSKEDLDSLCQAFWEVVK